MLFVSVYLFNIYFFTNSVFVLTSVLVCKRFVIITTRKLPYLLRKQKVYISSNITFRIGRKSKSCICRGSFSLRKPHLTEVTIIFFLYTQNDFFHLIWFDLISWPSIFKAIANAFMLTDHMSLISSKQDLYYNCRIFRLNFEQVLLLPLDFVETTELLL